MNVEFFSVNHFTITEFCLIQKIYKCTYLNNIFIMFAKIVVNFFQYLKIFSMFLKVQFFCPFFVLKVKYKVRNCVMSKKKTMMRYFKATLNVFIIKIDFDYEKKIFI